jgi:hypothetical protein
LRVAEEQVPKGRTLTNIPFASQTATRVVLPFPGRATILATRDIDVSYPEMGDKELPSE